MPRLRLRVIVGLVAVVLLLGGAWLWLRDSSLVAVTRVSITGASGPDATQIRAALSSAARNMTTLDVRMDLLRDAVAPYPVVKDVHVSTQFPHGIRIRVIEQRPIAAVLAGGRQIAVAGDGTLLHDTPTTGLLPEIPLRVLPGGRRLTDDNALAAVALLSAAPYQWLGRVGQVITIAPHGLVAQIRGGPNIYFGDDSRVSAKWAAATAVLADPGSAGATYIDVTDPQRPAAGVGSAAGSGASASAAASAPAGSSVGAAASGSSAHSADSTGSSMDAASGPSQAAGG